MTDLGIWGDILLTFFALGIISIVFAILAFVFKPIFAILKAVFEFLKFMCLSILHLFISIYDLIAEPFERRKMEKRAKIIKKDYMKQDNSMDETIMEDYYKKEEEDTDDPWN